MKIAFVSCSNIIWQKSNQPIWGIIHGQKPDLLLLLGDNVYKGGGAVFNAVELERRYKMQLAEPHFNKLLCEVPYLAVWDNHDFGVDAHTFGGTVSQEQRMISRDLFNRYLKYRSVEPYTEHVYCSHTIGKIKFIMLDVRSHQKDPGKDVTTLLGTRQENWLLREMRSSTGITVICSGITYAYNNKGWKEYPDWFSRFNKAVVRTSKPIFLGGNIHRNYFKHHLISQDPVTSLWNSVLSPGGTNFYELISSSVGRSAGGTPNNKYGLIDIRNGKVDITLHSQNLGNAYHKIINVNNWELED